MAKKYFEWAPPKITIHDHKEATLSEFSVDPSGKATPLPGELWTAMKGIAGKQYASKVLEKLLAGDLKVDVVLIDPRSIKRWPAYGWGVATKDDPSVADFRAAMREGAVFPPIIVDTCRRMLFEGRHRVGAAFYEGLLIWAIDVCGLLPAN